MADSALNRGKHRDSQAGIYPLCEGDNIERMIAYQKRMHTYAKKHYHLNFYEIMILMVIKYINKEVGNYGASMNDITHYVGWDQYRKGQYMIARLISEGWIVNRNPLAPTTGQPYRLFLSVKCDFALNDVRRHCNVLLSALPPREGEKQVKVKRVVDIEKRRAKELAKWEGLGGA